MGKRVTRATVRVARTAEKRTKRVAYLIGAGATQGEATFKGAPVNLLMRDHDELGDGVSKGVLKRAKVDLQIDEDRGVDIEKVISLLSSSGVARHSTMATRMRKAYFEEVRDRLSKAKILDDPALTMALLQMHENPIFSRECESLSGIITTNHDGLLQVASSKTFGAVNPGFAYESKTYAAKNQAPPILQLHGSFSWQFAPPIKIERLQARTPFSQSTLWLPPSILKESKQYPFNKLGAAAYEMLSSHCDVLRVIGSSLTQNDWNVLSLIFNAQRHQDIAGESAFEIELIVDHEFGLDVKRSCSYLRAVRPLGFLSDGDFGDFKNKDIVAADPDLQNSFAAWLSKKARYHLEEEELDREKLGPELAAIIEA